MMTAFSALIILAAVTTAPIAENARPNANPVTSPALVEIPKGPDNLTLYNAKGEVVARCEKKDESFGNCKIEAGYNLDDLMNAWVHAYEDLAK
jgi:hypothetical protein